FIKNDGQQTLRINELSGRIYLNDAAALKCESGSLTFSQKFSLIRYKYMSKVRLDRKSTRLNSSHVSISYAVFCLKKKKEHKLIHQADRRRRNRDGIPVQEQPVRVLAELIAHDRCCQTSRHGHQRWLHGRDRHERL